MTEFRILALSGGGARGILQAVFLDRLERTLRSPIGDQFDLIAATSTGALVGLGLAVRQPAHELVGLYRQDAREIFRRRWLAGARRGPQYSEQPLRRVLEQRLGGRRLRDLQSEVLICASGLDTFEGRVFTRDDGDLLAVDVALATAAAPTYFAPVVPKGQYRAYVDGGLWANDPSHVAVSHAIHRMGISSEDIRVLMVGTGRRSAGITAPEVSRQRTWSLRSLRFFLDFNANLQAWQAETMTAERLDSTQIRRIDPRLPEWIALDDVEGSLSKLPGVAETEFDRCCDDLVAWLQRPREESAPAVPILRSELVEGLAEAGVSAFIPSRAHYARLRSRHESISRYIAQAERTLTVVGINLATGVDMEQIQDTLRTLLLRDPPVEICVSLLDPDQDHLMRTIAPMLGQGPEQVAQRIRDALRSLSTFGTTLPPESRTAFVLRRHRALPSASAIMLDANLPTGRIQLEAKPYRASYRQSWAVEFKAGSELFTVLRDSYDRLMADGVAADDGALEMIEE